MKTKLTFNKILVITAGIIVIFVLSVTVILFITKKVVPGYGLRTEDPTPESVAAESNQAAYASLGQLRSTTKPSNNKSTGIPVVVSPWLTYNAPDTAFFEELDSKNRSIRALIISYFARYTEQELISRGELSVKADLLQEINDTLVLGKITAIYFNEYLFFE